MIFSYVFLNVVFIDHKLGSALEYFNSFNHFRNKLCICLLLLLIIIIIIIIIISNGSQMLIPLSIFA